MKPDRITSTDYRNPYRPRAIAAGNFVGRWLPKRRMRAEAWMKAARRRTGLHDFGGESFVEPLSLLLESIEDEARLHPVGRFITRERLVGVLCNRLRAQKAFVEHPEIEREGVDDPVVIIGLQRTGTTMLQRLLAADPRMRSLASWEALSPAPLKAHRGEDPRIGSARTAQRALAYMAPDFFAVHPVQAEAPEEDVLLLDASFLSTVAEATLHVPRFAAWLEQQDQTPAYAYMRRLLQLLQWQRRGERWVLKTPHHLEWLDTLLQVFPRAKLIQTHRDPSRTIASFCSMLAHGRGVFSDHVDPHELAQHWVRKIERMLSRAMASRKRMDDDRVIDVAYADLIADPMAQLERIYDHIGWELSDDTRAVIEKTHAENPANRFGVHRYSLDDFGLSRSELKQTFAEYCERHAVVEEHGGAQG